MAKLNYSYKTRRSDTLTNRMMIVFVLMCLGVFLLSSIKNWLISDSSVPYLETYMKLLPYLPIIPLVLFAVTLFFFFKNKKADKDEALKTFSSSFILSLALVVLVVSLLVSNFAYKGYVPSIIFVVLASLLYFVAISFPGSYFLMALFNSLGAFSLYALNLISPISHRVQDIIARVVVIALALFFLFFFMKNRKDGKILGTFKLITPNAHLLPILSAVVLFVVFVLLGMFSVGSFVIFDIILGIETIVFALFYAIKMLK